VLRSSQTALLESLVHPRDSHPKVLVMLEGYFDETGIHDGADICIVAGYYAARPQWKKYEVAWKRILRREGIKEFHAKVFFGPAPQGSEYYGWSTARRKWYISDLLEAITDNELHAIGAGVMLADWNRLDLKQRRYLTGAEYSPALNKFKSSGCPTKPYFLPFQDCILKVIKHCKRGEKAHFFFDLNKQFSGYSVDLYALIKKHQTTFPFQSDSLGTLSLPTGLEAVHLQAADLFCYLLKQHMNSKLTNNRIKSCPMLKRATLHSRASEDSSLYDWEEFARKTFATQRSRRRQAGRVYHLRSGLP
jgi:hypothetical protein